MAGESTRFLLTGADCRFCNKCGNLDTSAHVLPVARRRGNDLRAVEAWSAACGRAEHERDPTGSRRTPTRRPGFPVIRSPPSKHGAQPAPPARQRLACEPSVVDHPPSRLWVAAAALFLG